MYLNQLFKHSNNRTRIEKREKTGDSPQTPAVVSRREALRRSAAAAATVAIGGGLGTCCGCQATPYTNRRRVVLIPESREIALGATAFQETLAEENISSNQRLTEMVNRVGSRIAQASGRSDYGWEFKLIASSTQNAFALPGVKVAIYEGILPVCENEAGLAVVMSHEVAHAIARHGGERMTKSGVADFVGTAISTIATAQIPDRSEQLMQAYGVVSKYGVLLPYTRLQETEADHIGVMLMAQAGYDPTVAPAFWRRFGEIKGAQQSEWFSTHPSDERRASDLLALMDQASSLYAGARTKFGLGERII